MSILKGIVESSQSGLAGTDYTFIDADTLVKPDGTKYRIQGIDAPEVEKVVNGKYQLGDAGGAASTDTLRSLANDMEFSNVVPILDANGDPVKDKFGRTLVDLKNRNGESFKSKILESGILKPTAYTGHIDRLTAEIGKAERDLAIYEGRETEPTDWDKARIQLEKAMVDEGAKSKGFKMAALDEANLAALKAQGLGHYVNQDNVQIRSYDRSLDNKSLNPFSDSWEQGWIGVKEASYGVLNMLGETTGSETLANIGEAGVERARTQIRDYGTTITDWKEIKDVGTAFDYITNNAALSLPYMAISIAGVAAAPVTGGASLAAPASVYAGQTWNEMEGEKNAGVAIASGITQAALDRIGLGFIFKKGIGSTQLLDQAVNKLVAGGMTKEAAKQKVFTATRKEMAGFVGDVSTIAKSQLTAKAIFKDMTKRGLVAGAGEAVTEGLQEATGYTAATLGSDKVFDYNELNDRILAGVIAGGALGKTFSIPGAVYNTGAWADVAFRQAPADISKLSRAGKHAEYEVKNHGRVKSIQELNEETKGKVKTAGPNAVPSFQERIDAFKEGRKGRSVKDQIYDTLIATPALWRGATRNIFTPDMLDKSRAARVLADMFGGQLQRTFSGSNYENAKHHKVATYKNMVSIPEKVFSVLNGGKKANRFRRGEISDQIYTKIKGAIDPKTKKFNPDLIPDSDPNKQTYVDLYGELTRLGDKLYSDQKKHNPNLGYLENYLLRYKSFNKKAIVSNKIGFIQALRDEFPSMTEAKALEVYSAITSSTEINDLSDALDATQAARYPGSHKKRTLDLADRDRFKEFMEKGYLC